MTRQHGHPFVTTGQRRAIPFAVLIWLLLLQSATAVSSRLFPKLGSHSLLRRTLRDDPEEEPDDNKVPGVPGPASCTAQAFLVKDVAVEFEGIPALLTADELEELEFLLNRAYTVSSEFQCGSRRSGTGVSLQNPGDQAAAAEVSFTLAGRVILRCDGCNDVAPIFGGSPETDASDLSCFCAGPTVTTYLQFANTLLGDSSIQHVTAIRRLVELEPVQCAEERSDFQGNILLDVSPSEQSMGGGLDGDELAAFEDVILRVFAVLLTTTPAVCDPNFRRIRSIRLIPIYAQPGGGRNLLLNQEEEDAINRDHHRRRAQLQDGLFQSAAPSESHVPSSAPSESTVPSFLPTSYRTLEPTRVSDNAFFSFTFAALYAGDCRGCPDNSLLFNDLSGRRTLQRTQNTTTATANLGHLRRMLTEGDEECVCPVGAQQRGPTENEFRRALQDAIDSSPELTSVEEVINAFEVIAIDCPPQSPDIHGLIVEVFLYLPSQYIRNMERFYLEGAFRDAYNDQAEQYCDIHFRTVRNAELLNTFLVEDGPTSDTGIDEYRVEFRVQMARRGGSDDLELFGDSSRRQLFEAEHTDGTRRLADDGDSCFCPTTPVGLSAQSREDFLDEFHGRIRTGISRGRLTNVWLDQPTPTGTPTQAPTAQTAAPSDPQIIIGNDNCYGAIPLPLSRNQFLVYGGSNSFDHVQELEQCGYFVFVNGPGRWYTVRGRNSVISVSTCNDATTFDTQITVFNGGSCRNLDCVDANDDNCGLSSSVSWFARRSETYFIFVHGYAGSTGNFGLSIVEQNVVENDSCENAIGPLAVDGTVTFGSTVGARPETGFEACGDASLIDSTGVWYTVEGTNDWLIASTCDFTDFDTQLSVYVGSCGSLSCIDGNDQSCGDQSRVSWFGESGQVYSIFVHGYFSAEGSFGLSVREFDLPPNDQCGSATYLPRGNPVQPLRHTVLGNTIRAGLDAGAVSCGVPRTGTYGVWYRVPGVPGSRMGASTCSSYTNFDTQISVYQGSCGGLVCIDGNDDLCHRQSAVNWNSNEGDYYILVHGYFSDFGFFELRVQELVVPPNDLCVGAIRLPAGRTVTGSTLGATADYTGPSCGESVVGGESAGVWYTVTGTGGILSLSTCENTDFDTQISVFTGTCSNLVCVGGNDDFCGSASKFSFTSAEAALYFVRLHGRGSSSGDFELYAEDVSGYASRSPSEMPSDQPSDTPSTSPSAQPSFAPSESSAPSTSPSDVPSISVFPSVSPSDIPSVSPSDSPSDVPSVSPSSQPSVSPSDVPSHSPSDRPSISASPSDTPSVSPSDSPSRAPSVSPSDHPSLSPSDVPSRSPSDTPTASVAPSDVPSVSPSDVPSLSPSDGPTHSPSSTPTYSVAPSDTPSVSPSDKPSLSPSDQPSLAPSDLPSKSALPSDVPSLSPSFSPSDHPSGSPTYASEEPSISRSPSDVPSLAPSDRPSGSPTHASEVPSLSMAPSDVPSLAPSDRPSGSPTFASNVPSDQPSGSPTYASEEPSLSLSPSDVPSLSPSDRPSGSPTFASDAPSDQPSGSPTYASEEPSLSLSPSDRPSGSPTFASDAPSDQPSGSPTYASEEPSLSRSPSDFPSLSPSDRPSGSPTFASDAPSDQPSDSPVVSDED